MVLLNKLGVEVDEVEEVDTVSTPADPCFIKGFVQPHKSATTTQYRASVKSIYRHLKFYKHNNATKKCGHHQCNTLLQTLQFIMILQSFVMITEILLNVLEIFVCLLSLGYKKK